MAESDNLGVSKTLPAAQARPALERREIYRLTYLI